MSLQEDLQLAGHIAHVKPLGSLAEKVQPTHTALLIIDMQNDFLRERRADLQGRT